MCASEDKVSSLSWSKDVGTYVYKAPEINVKYDNVRPSISLVHVVLYF